MREPKLAEDRPARYRKVALEALARLSGGKTDAATVHRARTHLRRLQAYLELVGEDRQAVKIAYCVSRVSKLRTLQVFAQYLKQHGAPRTDRKVVKRRLRVVREKLARSRVYAAMERDVRRVELPAIRANQAWLAGRMQSARTSHANTLRRASALAGSKVGRKQLHWLRLLIKSIRYQEEWALGRPFARPDRIRRLKQAQKVLGDYEDLVHFRKLARSLGLRSWSTINKAWRKARSRARALPAGLPTMAGIWAGSRGRATGTEPD